MYCYDNDCFNQNKRIALIINLKLQLDEGEVQTMSRNLVACFHNLIFWSAIFMNQSE